MTMSAANNSYAIMAKLEQEELDLEQLKRMYQRVQADPNLSPQQKKPLVNKITEHIWLYSVRQYDGC